MIKEIQIQNFKCFQQPTHFRFSKMNLLTGINGRGKSSLLQSLLVLSQSSFKTKGLEELVINDELVSLGNYDDIKNSETPRGENIRFNFVFDSALLSNALLEFTENPDNPLIADCVKIETQLGDKKLLVEPKKANYEWDINTLASSFKKIHFVSADRLGPVKYVDKSVLPEFLHVGPRGEHSINILANSVNLENVNDRLYRGQDAKSLIQQTIEWMSYILEGAKIEIGGREKESSVLYMLLNNKSNSYSYKPANVGFGYSYILPLVITGLLAKPGEIIIIENPEAHLHPRAQAKIAEFFSLVASIGVQVFIESHSEHILNGLRVAALNHEIEVAHDELFIHYFNETFCSEELNMDARGKIANWPFGFFDQQEIHLSEIFKLSRNT